MIGTESRCAALALALAAVLAVAACSSGGQGTAASSSATAGAANGSAATAGNARLSPAQRQNIQLYTVAPSRFRKSIETSGAVDFDADQATTVLAPFGGPVSRLLVSLGQQVQKGEPLAEVQSPDFATAIDTYRKALATARTDRRLADLDQDLLQHHGVSQREAEQAETDAVNAEADRDAALQGLVSLNVTPQSIQDIQDGRTLTRPDGLIRSPIAGTVVEKLITPGELLQAGSTPCFTVADLSRVWVLAQVFGSDLDSISVGDSADIETGTDSRRWTGRVDNIASLVDPDTRSVSVRVVVQNPESFLKKQMYVRVMIHAGQESTGLLVPVGAILRDDENLPFVYVAQADGSFARQRVTLGYRTGTQVELPAGLHAGEQIVVDGGLFVQFMQAQ
jgi:cobalt-zinc-cadmium efflux system membrane fusion protein